MNLELYINFLYFLSFYAFMKYSDDVKELAQLCFSRKMSDEDIDDYLAFMRQSGDLAKEKKQQIIGDISDIVLRNEELLNHIAKNYKKKYPDNPSSKPPNHPLYLSLYKYKTHQVNLVSVLDSESKVLASAPDVYHYLKTLDNVLVKGDHKQISNARKKLSDLKSHMPVLTSSRLFYNYENQTAKLVHNYGSPVSDQIFSEFSLPNNNLKNNCWPCIKKILDTSDSADVIRKTFRLLYSNPDLNDAIFPDKALLNKITCGTVYFDSSGMGLFKCGVFFNEKWGFGLYKLKPNPKFKSISKK